MSTFPNSLAKYKGVWPLKSVASTSAPYRIRVRAVSSSPCETAS